MQINMLALRPYPAAMRALAIHDEVTVTGGHEPVAAVVSERHLSPMGLTLAFSAKPDGWSKDPGCRVLLPAPFFVVSMPPEVE